MLKTFKSTPLAISVYHHKVIPSYDKEAARNSIKAIPHL